MFLINPYIYSGGGSSYLLDTYGSSVVAYSLRKVESTYSGNIIRVRRSSDDTEQDIGLSGDLLDTSALTTFVGANDGFVVSWYDQSGNGRTITQSTATNQPKIVSSGTVIVGANGLPAIETDGGDFLNNSGFTVPGVNMSIFCVWKANANGTNQAIFDASASAAFRQYFVSRTTTLERYYSASGNFTATALGSNQFLISITQDSTPTALIQENNSTLFNDSTGIRPDNSNGWILFKRGAGNYLGNGSKIQEFIQFNSDLTSQIDDVNTDINNYYSIY